MNHASVLAVTSQTTDHTRGKGCFEFQCFNSLENIIVNDFFLKKVFKACSILSFIFQNVNLKTAYYVEPASPLLLL